MGAGGIYGTFLTTLIITEGRDIASIPSLSVVNLAWEAVTSGEPEAMAKASQRLSGFGNLWYTDMAFRSLVYDHLLGNPYTSREYKKMAEMGQESFID